MKRVCLRGAALAALCAMLCGAATDEGPKLRNLERELNQAIATRDAQRVSDLLSDDWLLVTGTGKVKTKQEILAEIVRPDLEFQDNETRDVMVRIWGDTAVLTGTLHQRYRLRGQQQEVTLRYTDTWTRSGESWRQVSGHASRLPD
ncbi:MAG TPA: nuclear transport factor 2 family protein [Casimicrobiaceae bacterium]|jgi:ketosteroid isomerase-like protein